MKISREDCGNTGDSEQCGRGDSHVLLLVWVAVPAAAGTRLDPTCTAATSHTARAEAKGRGHGYRRVNRRPAITTTSLMCARRNHVGISWRGRAGAADAGNQQSVRLERTARWRVTAAGSR